MNLLEFIEEYKDESSCHKKFKEVGIKLGLYAKSVQVLNITGYQIKRCISAKNAGLEQDYVAVP